MNKLNPFRKLFSWFLAFFVIVIIIKLGYGLVGFNIAYSEGDYTGQMIKLSEKGLIWKTWEGRMGITSWGLVFTSYLGYFDFSIDPKNPNKEKILKELQEANNNGTLVKIHYMQRYASLPWKGQKSIFIQSVTSLRELYEHATKGQEAYTNGQYDQLIPEGQAIIKLATDNFEKSLGHYWIGLGNYRAGNKDIAEKEEQLAISLNPQNAGPYVTLGAIRLDRQDYKKAEELGRKAIQLEPKWPWGYNLLGLALADQGNKEEGIKQIQKAVELAPDSEIFKQNLEFIKSK